MAKRPKSQDLTPWGQRILQLLDGRSQAWLAREAGIDATSLNSTIKHAEPRASAAVRIARTLGTTVEYLMTGSEDQPRERLPSLPVPAPPKPAPGFLESLFRRNRS